MPDSLENMDTHHASHPDFHWTASFASTKAQCALSVVATLLGALFFEHAIKLCSVWSRDANYTHGFLILPISGVLAYLNMRASKEPLKPDLFLGIWTLALGCVAVIGTTIVHLFLAEFVALFLLLRGSALIIGGRRWASALTFPTLFFFFMFPLPITWTNFASVWLQDWVSMLSGKILELFFVCHQRGNMIVLAGADQPLYVAQECSGLRQLVAFLALAVLMAHLSRRGMIFTVGMVIASAPIAILSNVLRVLLMAVLIRYFGAASVSGWLHDLPALVTLPIGLLCFFLLLKLIGDFFPLQPSSGECSL